MSLSEYIFSDGLIQTITIFFRRCSRSDYIAILDHMYRLLRHRNKMSGNANGRFYALSGFAKVV